MGKLGLTRLLVGLVLQHLVDVLLIARGQVDHGCFAARETNRIPARMAFAGHGWGIDPARVAR